MEIMAKGKAANMRVIRLWIVCSSWITTSIYQEMACKMWATEMKIEKTAMRERDTGQRQCTGTSSEIFELNPKTKWKLLISLALILLSAPLRFHSVLSLLFSSIYICTRDGGVAHFARILSFGMRCILRACVRICIDSHLYQLCMCMCMFIFVQFLVRVFLL